VDSCGDPLDSPQGPVCAPGLNWDKELPNPCTWYPGRPTIVSWILGSTVYRGRVRLVYLFINNTRRAQHPAWTSTSWGAGNTTVMGWPQSLVLCRAFGPIEDQGTVSESSSIPYSHTVFIIYLGFARIMSSNTQKHENNVRKTKFFLLTDC
jgi:hypothetical protein